MLGIHALHGEAKADLVSIYPLHLSAEAMNAISILRYDQIGSKLQSESARELSGYVSDGIDIYWNDFPGKFTHRDAAKRTKISISPKCIWPQPGGRDVEISTPTGRYLPTTLIIQSLVKLFLLSWTCMTLYTLMMQWKDSLHNEITGFYDPICTLIKTMSSRSTVRHFIKTRQVTELDDIFLVLLTLGQQWQLGLALIHLWAVCSPMHVNGWAWPSVFSNPTNICFSNT